jgi:hypothetical protein
MKKLKSFVRLDGNNKVVPSSNITRIKKPTVGNWLEIPSTLCCTSTISLPFILVSTNTTEENPCIFFPIEITLYFNGEGTFPQIGDTLFYNSNGTGPVENGMYYKWEENFDVVYVTTIDGVIVNKENCGR